MHIQLYLAMHELLSRSLIMEIACITICLKSKRYNHMNQQNFVFVFFFLMHLLSDKYVSMQFRITK